MRPPCRPLPHDLVSDLIVNATYLLMLPVPNSKGKRGQVLPGKWADQQILYLSISSMSELWEMLLDRLVVSKCLFSFPLTCPSPPCLSCGRCCWTCLCPCACSPCLTDHHYNTAKILLKMLYIQRVEMDNSSFFYLPSVHWESFIYYSVPVCHKLFTKSSEDRSSVSRIQNHSSEPNHHLCTVFYI